MDGRAMSARRGVARLKDVAEAAGVSVSTVSRYLNRSIALPPETIARIEGAIARLDYRPNPHARSLSLGRSDTIGLVIPDVGNPFFAELAAAVEQAADELGLGLLLCATLNRPGRELDYIDRLTRNRVDGLLFVTNHTDDGALAAKINLARRIVLMDEDVVGTAVPKVFCDNALGGYLAGRHLVEAGHRRIAYVGGPLGMMSTTERLGGFSRALAEAGLPSTSGPKLFGDYTTAVGRQAAAALLDGRSRPSAVFAASDEIAIGLLEVLLGRGVTVPGELSVVAFDDVGPLQLFAPPLTAVHQPVAAMGRRGVEMVAAEIKGEESGLAAERLPVKLVVRSSVGPPATMARNRALAG
jgi:LacI family transcriptional regulator